MAEEKTVGNEDKGKLHIGEGGLIEAFEKITGYKPRRADLDVISMLGGTVDDAANYIWDHWLGEPEKPTVEDVRDFIIKEVQL